MWGSPIEVERRNRIRLSVAAYAYEFENDSIMSDGDFDSLAETIDLQISTENEKLDEFFKAHFSPFTGQWIHDHPELEKLKTIYNRYFRNPRKRK
jgi:hypothetical protein